MQDNRDGVDSHGCSAAVTGTNPGTTSDQSVAGRSGERRRSPEGRASNPKQQALNLCLSRQLQPIELIEWFKRNDVKAIAADFDQTILTGKELICVVFTDI